MRLDHIAYRVADRNKTAAFFVDAFGYKIQKEFEIEFKSPIQSLQIGERFESADGHSTGPYYVTRKDVFHSTSPIPVNSKREYITTVFFAKTNGFWELTKDNLTVYQGKAKCIALEPPEKTRQQMSWSSNVYVPISREPCIECGQIQQYLGDSIHDNNYVDAYHLAPEIFVSDGTEGSIVREWVTARGGVGGVHHMAYQVEDVRAKAAEWIAKGWSEFSGDVLSCPEDELEQVFTKPHPLTGVIYEFIKRGVHGFCEKNVENLMRSTKDNK